MKKLLPLLLLIFTLPLNASHFAGGDLQYVYIGDSTGVANEYLYILRLYRDTTGIPMPNTVDLQICSSCYSSSVVVLYQHGPAQFAPTLFDCVDPSAQGTVGMEVYEYRNTSVLPGICADYEFVTESLNARNGAVDNLNMGSGSSNLVITAGLNNHYGNNSSPKFVSEPVRAFCVGKNFNWKQSAIETDGDSIFFSLIPPKGGAWSALCNPLDYTFNTGWSYSQPIKTVPGTFLTIDEQSGLINFTPSSVEVDVLAVSVKEYRYDSLFYTWVPIGESTRDMQITVSPSCSPQAQAGVQLDYNDPSIYIDPINGLPTVDYQCLDSSVVLKFATKLDCSTISPDGTDFRLTSPSGQPIPIKELVPACDVNFDASMMLVKLHKPLSQNGKYFLYSKVGNDGNTLLNKCGFPMNEFDTIQLNVQNCVNLVMNLENVTIVDDMNPKIEWSVDTSSFKSYLFDKYKIFRKGPNSPYQHIADVYDVNRRSYTDPQIDWIAVDIESYDYKVEMVYNGQDMGKTREVNSILLKSMGSNCDSLDLFWNIYKGWTNAQYFVEIGTDDGSGLNWSLHSNINSPANPTSNVDYVMINNLPIGTHKIRIRTQDGNYTSYSNWIECSQAQPPVEEPIAVVLPNIITPDGNARNDGLIIKNIELYSSRRVTIYNRWGKVVYKTDNYDNGIPFTGLNSSGNRLADGVYFISLDLYDEISGKKVIMNQALTIISSL